MRLAILALALVGAPLSAQNITSITPNVVPSISPTNEQTIVINGSGFTGVDEVRVAGVSLSTSLPPDFTVINSGRIEFAMPVSPTLGIVRVEVIDGANKAVSTVEVVPPTEPTLRLGSGAPEEVFLTAFPFEVRAGGTPGNVAFVWLSELQGPTSSNLWDLAIGGGIEAEVFLWDQIELNKNGWGYAEYDASPVDPGDTVYFQITEFDPIKQTVPMPSSNVGTAYFVI